MKEILRAVAEATGVAPIARAWRDANDGAIDRLASEARKLKGPSGKRLISDERIANALRAQKRLEQFQSIVALVFPYLPNPKLLRIIAGPKVKK